MPPAAMKAKAHYVAAVLHLRPSLGGPITAGLILYKYFFYLPRYHHNNMYYLHSAILVMTRCHAHTAELHAGPPLGRRTLLLYIIYNEYILYYYISGRTQTPVAGTHTYTYVYNTATYDNIFRIIIYVFNGLQGVLGPHRHHIIIVIAWQCARPWWIAAVDRTHTIITPERNGVICAATTAQPPMIVYFFSRILFSQSDYIALSRHHYIVISVCVMRRWGTGGNVYTRYNNHFATSIFAYYNFLFSCDIIIVNIKRGRVDEKNLLAS